MRRPSPSALWIHQNCDASLTLPHAEEVSEAAERGTAGHRFLELELTEGREAAVAFAETVTDEQKKWLKHLSISSVLPTPREYRAETAIAYDWHQDTARVLTRNGHRDYGPLGETEIAGTVDVYALVKKFALYVGDYKFRRGDHGIPAPKNPQLRAYALFAARLFKRSNVTAELIYIDESGEATYDTVELDEFDLEEIAADLRKLMRHAISVRQSYESGVQPVATLGDWCTFCPSLRFCPAQTNLVRHAVTGLAEIQRGELATLTPEKIAEAYRYISTVEKVAKTVRETLKDIARQTPIYLGDEQWLGEVSGNDSVDSAAAVEALTELYGEAIAEKASEPNVTKKSIREAIALVAKLRGRTIAEVEQEALDALRKRGAITRGRPIVKEHRGEPPENGKVIELPTKGAANG